MIIPQLYLMMLALVPVVLLEGLIVSRSMSLKFTEAIKGMAFANVVSTVVGIPIAWALMLGLNFATT